MKPVQAGQSQAGSSGPASRAKRALRRFSRAYLRHLVNQEELLGLRLLSLHNLRFLLDLTANARAAIEEGRLAAYKTDALGRLASAAV